MVGLILILHFGSFQIVAVLWQTLGVKAEPIMSAPLHSTSLTEFWGKRWNLGFRQLAHELIFRKLYRTLGAGSAGFFVFVVSGLIHDLVISLPARGGYGLPSPKYKGHIRSLMYRLFDKAMLWELLNVERNPMDLVEVKGISKRKKRPRVLQVKDAWQMLDALVQPFRTIVLIGLCFGLRISEILGLRWTDFDFKRSVVLVQRSAVGKRLNKLKTEYSQDEVPIERGFILELKKWQALCLDTEEHWVFPSPVTGRPYHADSMRNDYLVPTGLKLGLGRIGFHTFRHTYRAWLDETGAPVGVQQKLMRHAHVSTTMDQYGNASALAKRKANRPIVQRLLQRPANQEVSIQ
jgi:integrase